MVATRDARSFARSATRVRRAALTMPGGVGSDFRLGISPTPLVVDHAEGPYLFDVDGNRLIDYYLGMGPMLLGHNPPQVRRAVIAQLEKGILFGAQSEVEYRAAELVVELVPCAEMVRFGSSGTEVVQAALRVARDATGRKTILAFEGHYHGWLDNIAWGQQSPGGGLMPFSRGQDEHALASLDVIPWNDADRAVDRISRGDLAAVIMEPAMCNSSAIAPAPGYLEAVRAACTEYETVLIFDEVITGFRLSPGGAQAVLGVTPDLVTLGKAIASGFPVACLAGRRELMSRIGGPGKVVHAGTYNGQALAMAATVATLDELRDGTVHAAVGAVGSQLIDGIKAALRDHAIEGVVQGWPQIFHVSLGCSEPIREFRDTATVDRERYVRFTTLLLELGVRALERGAWFVSSAHDSATVDETLVAVHDALAALR